MTFTILGAPRTKKNSSRLVRAGKHHRIIPSLAHQKWFQVALPQAKSCAAANLMIEHPVNVHAIFYRDADRGDLVGYMQALADLLEAAGIVEDDKWIMGWDGTRLAKDKARPRIEVEISAL